MLCKIEVSFRKNKRHEIQDLETVHHAKAVIQAHKVLFFKP